MCRTVEVTRIKRLTPEVLTGFVLGALVGEFIITQSEENQRQSGMRGGEGGAQYRRVALYVDLHTLDMATRNVGA